MDVMNTLLHGACPIGENGQHTPLCRWFILELTESFGFGLESESKTGFRFKSKAESCDGFRFGLGPNPMFKLANPETSTKFIGQ
jgi:hypothetical protein